jgi:hypothetical protein
MIDMLLEPECPASVAEDIVLHLDQKPDVAEVIRRSFIRIAE